MSPNIIPVYSDPFQGMVIRAKATQIAQAARMAGLSFTQPLKRKAPKASLVFVSDTSKPTKVTGNELDGHRLTRLVGVGIAAGVILSLFCTLI